MLFYFSIRRLLV